MAELLAVLVLGQVLIADAAAEVADVPAAFGVFGDLGLGMPVSAASSFAIKLADRCGQTVQFSRTRSMLRSNSRAASPQPKSHSNLRPSVARHRVYPKRGSRSGTCLVGCSVREGFVGGFAARQNGLVGAMDNPTGSAAGYHLFISYAGEDVAVAEQLASSLSLSGLQVWYAPFVLKVGDSILGSIERGSLRRRAAFSW